MTQEEFDNQQFSAGMMVTYDSEIVRILAIDFKEQLLGLESDAAGDADGIKWVRCENCELQQ